MEHDGPIGLLGFKRTISHCAKEMMETKPAFLSIQRDEKEIRVFQLAQDGRGIATSPHVIAERRRESIKDRHIENEVPNLVGLSTEYFLGEVITYEAIVPTEVVHEPRGIRPTDQGQGGQIYPRGPALRPMHKLGNGVAR